MKKPTPDTLVKLALAALLLVLAVLCVIHGVCLMVRGASPLGTAR